MPLTELFEYYDSLADEAERRNAEYQKIVNKNKK